MNNNKGFTLLEVLVAIVLMSIVMYAFNSLMILQAKQSAKFTKKLETTKVTYFASETEGSTRQPILCLSNKSNNDYALVCKAGNPCTFVSGKWVRGHDECDAGVLFK